MKRSNYRTIRIFTLILVLLALGIAGQLLRWTGIVTRAENVPANVDDATLANKFWTGGDNNNSNWMTNANWEGIIAPGPNDNLIFGSGDATRRINNNNFPANTNFGQIIIGEGDYVISGNPVFLSTQITATVSPAEGAGAIFNPKITLNGNNVELTVNDTQPFTLNGDIDLNGHTLTVGTLNPSCQNCSIHLNGPIISSIGAGSLTKNGPGTLVIGGGGGGGGFGSTNINAGALQLQGTLGRVNLNSGTFRAAGITGDIVATGAPANGVLEPGVGGNSTTTLNATAVTLAATSTLAVDLNGSSVFNYDRIIVNGQNVFLNGANLTVTIGNGFTPTAGQQFQIIDETGAGILAGQFAQGTSVTATNGRRFSITYNANPGSVVLTALGNTPFDYDGDRKTDISVFRPSQAAWFLQRSQAGFFGMLFGFGTDKIVPADYDGDGKTDIAVFRPADKVWFVANSSNGTFSATVFGLSTDIPAPADYDGDGKADLCVFRPSDGTWYRQNSSNGSFFAFQFGANGDKPTVGDFDGDGKSDIAVYRPSTGTWFQVRSTNGSFFGEQFGFSTDKIVPADYDGDGKADLAVYRPSDRIWYIKNSSNSTYTAFVFGLSTDIPAPGDYDGDGKADLCVFRNSDGTWYRQNSSNGSFFAFQFGLSGDTPTPNAFN